MFENSNKYDLETRTTKFSKDLIMLCKQTPPDITNTPLLSQLIRSGTSIGANYHEANGASSKRDFRNKITICKREGKETMYWLELLAHSCPKIQEECRILWKESKELTLIFSTIAKKSK